MEGNAILMGRQPTPDQFEELTWALAEQGRAVSASTYLLTVTFLQGIARQVARFFVKHDVWLTPVLAEPPLPLGSFDPQPGNPLYGIQRAVTFVPFTPICNVTGQPAMSVPLFWNSEGLPIGTHFVGRFGDEATLFRLAAQLEASRPWAGRRPKAY
jgi:amidase